MSERNLTPEQERLRRRLATISDAALIAVVVADLTLGLGKLWHPGFYWVAGAAGIVLVVLSAQMISGSRTLRSLGPPHENLRWWWPWGPCVWTRSRATQASPQDHRHCRGRGRDRVHSVEDRRYGTGTVCATWSRSVCISDLPGSRAELLARGCGWTCREHCGLADIGQSLSSRPSHHPRLPVMVRAVEGVGPQTDPPTGDLRRTCGLLRVLNHLVIRRHRRSSGLSGTGLYTCRFRGEEGRSRRHTLTACQVRSLRAHASLTSPRTVCRSDPGSGMLTAAYRSNRHPFRPDPPTRSRASASRGRLVDPKGQRVQRCGRPDGDGLLSSNGPSPAFSIRGQQSPSA